MKNEIGQMAGAETVEQLPGRLSPRWVKPKVQFAFGIETESTIRVRELVTGESEVEQDSIDRFDIQLIENNGQFAKVSLYRLSDSLRSTIRHVQILLGPDRSRSVFHSRPTVWRFLGYVRRRQRCRRRKLHLAAR